MNNRRTAAYVLMLCFLLPAVVMTAAFAVMSMAPFGDKSILIMDMSGQYIEFLNGLKHGDVYFSWSKAMGGGYIGVFAYYVSSPLSLLTLLVPNAMMPVGVLFLTVLKIGLAGLSFGFYLLRRHGRAGPGVVLFALFYGLMSYNIGYSMGIMWLDGVIWLPVLLLGVERILSGQKTTLLIAALFVSFLSNYYISYMTGLFTALYFIVRAVEENTGWKRFWQGLGKLSGSAALAACGGAFLLYPALLSLFQGKIGAASMEYAGPFTFTWSRAVRKLLPGAYDSITNSGTPFLYCGGLAMLLFAAFFFIRTIPARSKWVWGGLAAFMALSMWLSPLDKAWHVFQYPNWFPYRYAFLFSFIILAVGYRAWLQLGNAQTKLKTGTRTGNGKRHQAILWVIIGVCALEMLTNAIGILKGLDGEFRYESFPEYRQYHNRMSSLVQKARDEALPYSRVGSNLERSKNEPVGFGYSGLTHYSSAYNRSVNEMLRKLGFAQSYFWSSYMGSTMVTDAVFSVQHVLSPTPVAPDYRELAREGGVALYENPYVLSLGMAVPNKALARFGYGEHPFDNQNRLLKALTETERDAFAPLASLSNEGEVRSNLFRLTGNGMPVYAYFTPSGEPGKLLVNGREVSPLFTSDTDRLHYIGTFPRGETFQVKVDHVGQVRALFYYMDMEVFKDAVGRLQESALNVESFSRGKVEGRVQAKTDTVLFTSIPYDKGWEAYVDGRKTKPGKALDALLTVSLPPGEHRVELVYQAPGLGAGVLLSVLAGCVLLLLVLRGNRTDNKLRGSGIKLGESERKIGEE